MGLRLGRYETIREIASGGMATVHLGRVTGEGGFQRLVAIKVMHQHLVKDEEFVAMFLDEARLAARIRHPNVVATLDVQKTPEATFLVMDYIEGASLHEISRFSRKRGETLPLGIALRALLDVLTGLHAAHELADDDGELLQLVHRDVTPQNVLIGKDGVARLTDFGVARAESRLSSTRGGQLKGKVAYMPPEQILGELMDRRSDVYAAGVVLWETLVGHRLFRAANEGALVHTIVQGAPRSPTEENQRVPAAISRACMRALSVPPGERHPTAAAFADELEDAARTAGIPVASSRAVSTFMSQILPELDPTRSAGPPSTPASRPEATPARSEAGSAGAARGARPTSTEQSGPSPSGAPAASGPTHTEAVVPRGAEHKRRSRTLMLAGAALLAVVGIAIVAWLGLGSPSPEPAGAAAPGPSASALGDPAWAEPPPDRTAASTTPTDTAATESAAPATAATTGATATELALTVTAQPQSSTSPQPSVGRPRPTGGRPGSGAAKPGATSYDPDKL